MAQRPTDRKSHPGIEADEFGQRLSKAGLTKARFAELTGIRRTTVIRWKNGTTPAWTVPWLWMWSQATKTLREKIEKWADFAPP